MQKGRSPRQTTGFGGGVLASTCFLRGEQTSLTQWVTRNPEKGAGRLPSSSKGRWGKEGARKTDGMSSRRIQKEKKG